MKIFIDSASLSDIEPGLKKGFASGVTTNPSLLSKEPKSSFEEHIKKIIALINQHKPGAHLSVEVFSTDKDEILRQAQEFVKLFNYPQISIKIQVGWAELETIARLKEMGISVNCTACMTPMQAIMAAHAGAKYVSIFWGRISDGGIQETMKAQREAMLENRVVDKSDFDPFEVTKTVRKAIDDAGLDCEIIVGSIRGVIDIRDAGVAGAHIVTVPPKFFPEMMKHYKTDQVVEQFLGDFKEWLS